MSMNFRHLSAMAAMMAMAASSDDLPPKPLHDGEVVPMPRQDPASRDAAAALQADRKRRKAENFAKRQPK